MTSFKNYSLILLKSEYKFLTRLTYKIHINLGVKKIKKQKNILKMKIKIETSKDKSVRKLHHSCYSLQISSDY